MRQRHLLPCTVGRVSVVERKLKCFFHILNGGNLVTIAAESDASWNRIVHAK